jgi:tetratricopeptide (TPR) repeat protein
MGEGGRSVLWQRIAVALLPAVLSLPRFWNGFVFDDVFVIAHGTFIHDPQNLAQALVSRAMVASSLNDAVGTVALDTYRPLSIVSFFWDAALSGREPWAYHLTNMVLHALNCVLVLELLRKLVRAPAGLLVGCALCFGLAPWLAEAHVFINGRSDLFLTLFVVGAALVQRQALERERAGRAALAATLLFLALLSKETAVLAAPFVVLVPSQGVASLHRRARYALPHVAAVLVYLFARSAVLSGLRTHSDAHQLFAALANLPLLWADALLHLYIPSLYVLRNLRDDYAAVPIWLRALAWLFLLGSAAGFALMLRRRVYPLVWALGLTFCSVSPAVMITTVLWQGFGRYLYLPAVGTTIVLAYAIAWLTQRAPASQRVVRALPYALAALSGACLLDASFGFRDDVRLYARALARAPEQAWTGGSLGLAYKRAEHCDLAIPLLRRADELAPDESRYALQLTRCLLESGALDQARARAREGQRRFYGTRAEAGFLLAEFLTLPRGSAAQAEPLLRRCLRLWPGREDCREGLALVQAERGSQAAP